MLLGGKEYKWRLGLKLRDEVKILKAFGELENRLASYISSQILNVEGRDTEETIDAFWKDVAGQALEGNLPSIMELDFAQVSEVGRSFFTRGLRTSA